MKRLKTILTLTAAAAAFSVAPLGAATDYSGSGATNPGSGRLQGLSGVGTRAAEFLTIPVGPRAVAMGGAYAAAADEISAIYWNPAGLGFIENREAFLTVIERPLDIRYTYGAIAVPVWQGKLVLGVFLSILG